MEETGYNIEVNDFIAANEVDNNYFNDKGEPRQLYHIGSFYFIFFLCINKTLTFKFDYDILNLVFKFSFWQLCQKLFQKQTQ